MQINVPKGYETLGQVMEQAIAEAIQCKEGQAHHANGEQPFEQQKICRISRSVGVGFLLGQAEKKIEASLVLADRGPTELLGAINYLAAAVIVMIEQQAKK